MQDSLRRNSSLLILSQAINAGAAFLFWIICARLFTTTEVGLAVAIVAFSSLVSTFTNLGLPNTVIRFLPTSKRPGGLFTCSVYLATFGFDPRSAFITTIHQGPGAKARHSSLVGISVSDACVPYFGHEPERHIGQRSHVIPKRSIHSMEGPDHQHTQISATHFRRLLWTERHRQHLRHHAALWACPTISTSF